MEPRKSPSDPARKVPLLIKLIYWHKLFESDSPPRLGIKVEKRIPYATTCAFTVGSMLGYYHGSNKTGMRFRAENAHRFPTTSTGWFQYHKTKNYVSIVGGVKDAMKMGSKLGAGALAFCLFEETVDYARHDERDFISTVTAGLSFSGLFSLFGEPADRDPSGLGRNTNRYTLLSPSRCVHSCSNCEARLEDESGIRIATGCLGVNERESPGVCGLSVGQPPVKDYPRRFDLIQALT